MTVKDLVLLYESSSESPTSLGTQAPTDREQRGKLSGQIQCEASVQLPPPTPARFIKSEARLNTPSTRKETCTTQHPLSMTHSTTSHDYGREPFLDINGSLQEPKSIVTVPIPRVSRKNSRFSLPNPFDTLTSNDRHPEQESLSQFIYPPNLASGADSPLKDPCSTSYGYNLPFHKPVPAQTIFARYAYALSLPKLDEYLALLSPTDFRAVVGDSNEGMFLPMDQLAKAQMSLDDMENNSTVVPFWRDRKLIFGRLLSYLLGILGSSALASFYNLQGLINMVQIFALILSTIVPVAGKDLEDKWKKLLLGTIPNVLALNFATVMSQSLLFLTIFLMIAAILLYYFYRSIQCDSYSLIEGLQQTKINGKRWDLLLVTFFLTIIYLPLSTMSIRVLVWSEELWAIPNPYTNSTVFPPVLAPLGPPAEFRDPLNFCWTTTMKRNEVNFAPISVILSSIALIALTIWYPIALRRIIRQSVPKVDKFTELGRPRNQVDMDAEYQRLLDRDPSPFAFLYYGFRRGWATYESTYLIAKLSTLLIVAVIDPNNCFFRSLSRSVVPIARQVLLLLSTIGFFVAQCIFTPFLDPVNNASEWTSRLSYIATAMTALAVTLNLPGSKKLNSYILFSIYFITYGLVFYFTFISFNWMQRVVKRLTRRIDFSIDVFSPRLDISSSSIHTKRRIWQESITTLLLTDSECHIPAKQSMVFSQARDSEYPPFLLGFAGTPGERHVENLKILREVGSGVYRRAVALTTGPDFAWYRYIEDEIQKNYIGPDSYWKKPGEGSIDQHASYFGNAWWIPFPPTLVLRYDDGPYAILSDVLDLKEYIAQNSSFDIQRKRYIRISLRVLDGQNVRWPYEHLEDVGSQSIWNCGRRRRYKAVTSTHFQNAVLRIKRQGQLAWQELNLGSGFQVELNYSKRVTVLGEVIGLTKHFDLTPPLARFLELNKQVIDGGLYEIEEKLSSYRRHHRKECLWKRRVLSYRFLVSVYDRPRDPTELVRSSIEHERDYRVRRLMMDSEVVFKSAYNRLAVVSTSEVATWWYIFWDDLWRRNHDTIAGLERHAADFNPHFVTSIAYTPLPRAALESFLKQRGLLHSRPRWNDFFHAGFLNKVYSRLNDIVFRDSDQAIMYHLGDDQREMNVEDIDALTQGGPSTLGTGGGTDHNDSWIRFRPTYRWEGLLSDPPHKGGHEGRRKWLVKLEAWFGISPLWRSGLPSNGISFDVRLKNGRYVLLDD